MSAPGRTLAPGLPARALPARVSPVRALLARAALVPTTLVPARPARAALVPARPARASLVRALLVPVLLLPSLLLSAPLPAGAEVIRFVVTSREPFGEDVPDKVGPYERIRGRVVYALDPTAEANAAIVDLDRALTNGEGRVEFYGDVEILAPRDLRLAQPTVLYDINNRGRRLWGGEPFFLRRGYVTVSGGWIAEVRVDPRRLRLEAPVAHDEAGVPIVGPVRAEIITEAATPLATISDRDQLAYEPVLSELPHATLTRRRREADPPQPIPRADWRFHVVSGPREEGSGLIDGAVELAGGFEPGWIYELIYLGRGSVVQGTGFAAIRDLVSFLRHDRSEENPLRHADGEPVARRVIGEGRSQSGRALRMFLHEGFNADERGRPVFDGAMPIIAGGGQGFFNHRFASPTRTATQHAGHLYPVDVFPFTYGDETDPFTGRTDGLLRRARAAGVVPKVMHLDTSSEYWHRSASLVVTDPTGTQDAELPPEVRIYVFGGAQHSPATGPSDRGRLPPNPTNYRPLQEALFLALDRWITDGAPPPPSVHPRIADGTLSDWRADAAGWRPLPGVRYPEVIQQPEHLDYGPAFEQERRIDHHPPLRTGKHYPVRVPAYDADNNELGTLRLPALSVPVATYTGWNLRSPAIGADDELLGLAGGYVPFPATEAERATAGDPRPHLAARYAGFDDYLAQYTAAARHLVAEGYLLEEHLPGVRAVAESHRALFAPQESAR